MARKAVTYKDAGVDIEAGDSLVPQLKKINPAIGGFGGFVPVPRGMRKPQMVLSTDGVGTKLLVAEELKVFNTIGIDLVAMVVNDIVTTGAKPLAFLDYFATDKLRTEQALELFEGIGKGCELAGCELTGGETAELPGIYPKGGFDLAGFGVGVVDKPDIIDGSRITAGDVVIGLPSSGLHSNGYSLARRVLLDGPKAPKSGKARKETLEQMLTPTAIYVKPLLKLFRKVRVKGLAHITGGGLPGNLVRALPEGCVARLDPSLWEPHPLFARIAAEGPVEAPEMYRVFNMGIGMCVVVAKGDAAETMRVLRRAMVHANVIGEIEEGQRAVRIVGVDA
jgi:phosphoribosylformylglycinamidine cyclo-ligase